jgi:hypothetical protein
MEAVNIILCSLTPVPGKVFPENLYYHRIIYSMKYSVDILYQIGKEVDR